MRLDMSEVDLRIVLIDLWTTTCMGTLYNYADQRNVIINFAANADI